MVLPSPTDIGALSDIAESIKLHISRGFLKFDNIHAESDSLVISDRISFISIDVF